jgi:hypothetical protein
VTFTPSIGRFAGESFVFRNAFTRHGGTELALPALWAGTTVVRRVRAPGFERMNALEKLIASEGYRVAINDYTVAGLLKTDDVTFLDPGIVSADTDLCQNVASLRAYLERPSRQPVFAFLAPMNVHILNTRRAGVTAAPEGSYPGFYAPYAQRLERLDRCFGEFIAFLKQQGRFDEAVVVLTSDHGDSLGENGYWGHAFWLFPEDIRLPLIVHVPRSMRERLTTDLARLTFSTDITPTLYGLLGHTFPVDGPLAGAPLFVDRAATLADRRRSAELVTSSYASTYGLLRRNGRFLYVSDLYERKEFAFDLGPQPLGAARFVDETERRLNRRLIRERVDAVARVYAVRHTPPR